MLVKNIGVEIIILRYFRVWSGAKVGIENENLGKTPRNPDGKTVQKLDEQQEKVKTDVKIYFSQTTSRNTKVGKSCRSRKRSSF